MICKEIFFIFCALVFSKYFLSYMRRRYRDTQISSWQYMDTKNGKHIFNLAKNFCEPFRARARK